jgi:hypothetical protein
MLVFRAQAALGVRIRVGCLKRRGGRRCSGRRHAKIEFDEGWIANWDAQGMPAPPEFVIRLPAPSCDP